MGPSHSQGRAVLRGKGGRQEEPIAPFPAWGAPTLFFEVVGGWAVHWLL